MAKRKRNLAVVWINAAYRDLCVEAMPDVIQEISTVEGVDLLIPTARPNRYMLSISHLYDFDEVVDEILLRDPSVPEIFLRWMRSLK